MSIFQRLALVGVVVAGVAGLSDNAEAQYYYQQSPYGYQQPAPYVSPKILRKQRQLEQRVYEKYGYPQQRRRNNYGYQQPQYRYPQQQYQQPRYRQTYPQQYYRQGAPSYQRQNDLGGTLQLRQGQSYVE